MHRIVLLLSLFAVVLFSFPAIASPAILVGACNLERMSGEDGASNTDGIWPMGSTSSCEDVGNGIPMPVKGTLKGLYVTGIPRNGDNNYVFPPTDGAVVVLVNGSATSITCTLGNNTSCNDKTHSVLVKPGDLVELQITFQSHPVSDCGPGCSHLYGGYTPLKVTLAKF